MLLKRISCAILVDICCKLVNKLRLRSPPSSMILISLISISGTDCTCLSVDNLHQNIPFPQTVLSVLPSLFSRKFDRALHLTTYTQHKVPVQLHYQYSMLPLYLSLQHKDPGFSPGFFPALELDGCFKQKQPHQLNRIDNHGVLICCCTYVLQTSG